jgi:hypothetical protein
LRPLFHFPKRRSVSSSISINAAVRNYCRPDS